MLSYSDGNLTNDTIIVNASLSKFYKVIHKRETSLISRGLNGQIAIGRCSKNGTYLTNEKIRVYDEAEFINNFSYYNIYSFPTTSPEPSPKNAVPLPKEQIYKTKRTLIGEIDISPVEVPKVSPDNFIEFIESTEVINLYYTKKKWSTKLTLSETDYPFPFEIYLEAQSMSELIFDYNNKLDECINMLSSFKYNEKKEESDGNE